MRGFRINSRILSALNFRRCISLRLSMKLSKKMSTVISLSRNCLTIFSESSSVSAADVSRRAWIVSSSMSADLFSVTSVVSGGLICK